MPDEQTADPPADELDPYDDDQKRAFVDAYRSALEHFGGDRERAISIAHAAARGTPGER